MKHLGVLKNSFKRVRAFQIKFNLKVFLGEEKTGVAREKEENQQQTQPTYGVDTGTWTQQEPGMAQHCATLAR